MAGSAFFFIANILNFVLATAVFTIPFPMHECGIILGTIILGLTCFVSVIACTFIIEALAMKNSIRKKESGILKFAIDSENENEEDKLKENLNPNNNDNNNENNNDISGVTHFKESILDEELNDDFYIKKRYEISKLAKLLPKPLYFFVVLTMIFYLYVGVTSNSIIAGNNLKDIIGKTFNTDLPEYSYQIIVSVFYFFVITIALNNINNLKKFSMFIMIMRFLIIALIIGCCVYSIVKNGAAKFKDIPKFDLSNITVMIGNSLFVFMSHHSIPGMVENFTPQKNLVKILILGYFFSFLFISAYGYIALFSFSKPDLTCEKVFPCAIQATFSSNFLGLPVIGYIINYYPILNVITSGMQLITLRNNILDAIAGCSPSLSEQLNFTQKEGCSSIFYNFIFNFFVAIPPIIIGLTLKNIQSLMKYFSSILGFLIMLIVPVVVVSRYRWYFNKRNYILGKLNQAFIKGVCGYVLVVILAVGIFSMIIFGFIKNIPAKTCVNEKVTFFDFL